MDDARQISSVIASSRSIGKGAHNGNCYGVHEELQTYAECSQDGTSDSWSLQVTSR